MARDLLWRPTAPSPFTEMVRGMLPDAGEPLHSLPGGALEAWTTHVTCPEPSDQASVAPWSWAGGESWPWSEGMFLLGDLRLDLHGAAEITPGLRALSEEPLVDIVGDNYQPGATLADHHCREGGPFGEPIADEEAALLDEAGERFDEALRKAIDARRDIDAALDAARAAGADPETIAALELARERLISASDAIVAAREKYRREQDLEVADRTLQAARDELERALQELMEAQRSGMGTAEARERLADATSRYKQRLREYLERLGLTPAAIDSTIESVDPERGRFGLLRPQDIEALLAPPTSGPTISADPRTDEERNRDLGRTLRNLLRLFRLRGFSVDPRDEQYLERMVREYNERARRFNQEPLPTFREFVERSRRQRRARRSGR